MKKMFKTFFMWAAISGASILGPMIVIDSFYYNKLVIAPWNIVKYNVLGGNGPELYGTEPFSFYIINGFLNFNIVWVNRTKYFNKKHDTKRYNFFVDCGVTYTCSFNFIEVAHTCQK